MPRYNYVARDMDGAVYKGVIQATGKGEVRRRLRQRGYYTTSVKGMREWSLKMFRRVKRSEIAVFAEQLAVMVDSGLTLVRCMETVMEQVENPELVRVITEVKQDVENGVTFSESLARHPKVFPPLFVSMVLAGETGGTLPKSLRQLADYLDREQETRQKVKSALTYPKIVGFVSVLVVFVLVTFIVPRFAAIFKQLGIKLPALTLGLMAFSRFMAMFWWLVALVGAGIYFLYKRLRNIPSVKTVIDKIKLHAPMFGDLNRKSVVSRFIRILSTLLPSGVPIMRALNVAEEVVDNRVMEPIIDDVRTNISAGRGMRDPIAASGIFPPMVVQMIGIGEETGRLGELLEKSCVYLDREIEHTIKRLITRIEPTMTVILAVIVATIALSIYLPMFDVIKGLAEKG